MMEEVVGRKGGGGCVGGVDRALSVTAITMSCIWFKHELHLVQA